MVLWNKLPDSKPDVNTVVYVRTDRGEYHTAYMDTQGYWYKDNDEPLTGNPVEWVNKPDDRKNDLTAKAFADKLMDEYGDVFHRLSER